jgi:hypothetical protein
MGKDYRTGEFSAIFKGHNSTLASNLLAKIEGLKKLKISC